VDAGFQKFYIWPYNFLIIRTIVINKEGGSHAATPFFVYSCLYHFYFLPFGFGGAFSLTVMVCPATVIVPDLVTVEVFEMTR
jgi:hypothetical protein